MHAAEAYASCGFHVIPITPGDKTPSQLLPERKWGRYQSEAADRAQVLNWAERQPDGNWALICGNGLACGDCDDLDAAAWVLAHPAHPIFEGACIVRSGHGKAHIWFAYQGTLASTTWRMVPGVKMGEIRAEGNYVVVPPSRLADGGVYERVAGSMQKLPTIADPALFLAGIVRAYLDEHPRAGVEYKDSDRTIVPPSAEALGKVHSRVKRDGFKQNIKDTLFVKGRQGVVSDGGPWNLPSNSEVDFAVCCEFVRKGWSFEEAEEAFANTLVGEACYQDPKRPHHGRGYLWATWKKAQADEHKRQADLNVPKGTNFEVIEARRLERGKDPLYTLILQWADGTVSDAFDIPSSKLTRESSFVDECFHATRRAALFKATQGGKEFILFAQAVARLSDANVRTPPHEFTEVGRLQARIRRVLSQMPDRTEAPQTGAEVRRLGWRCGDEYWIRPLELQSILENARVAPRQDDMWVALEAMVKHRQVTITWPDEGPEQFMYLRLPAS